jgi:hypothetical protein
MEKSLQFSGTKQAAIEAMRAVQETELSVRMAHEYPRKIENVLENIKTACSSPVVAEYALYAYKRGKRKDGKPNIVTGNSIRLAETLIQCMGNIQSGVRELSREKGFSEVETFCWDMQTNIRDSKTFQVEHERKAGGGVQTLTDPRDIYEHVANYAARRKRANMLAIIPQEIQDYAAEVCRDTILLNINNNMAEAVSKIILSFDKFDVSGDQLNDYLGHEIVDDKGSVNISNTEILELRQIYTSIRDGMTSIHDWFNVKREPAPNEVKDKFTNAKKDKAPEDNKKAEPEKEQELKKAIEDDLKKFDKAEPAESKSETKDQSKMHESWKGVPNVEQNIEDLKKKFTELYQAGLMPSEINSMEDFERKMGSRLDSKNLTYNKFWEVKDYLLKVERESKTKK